MEEEYRDRRLSCKDCGIEFLFEIGEQKFYKKRGYPPPKRCPACRKRHKALVRRTT